MSKNKIQLSDFSYVRRSKESLGKALRFTLSFSIEVGGVEPAELALEGCMAYYKSGIALDNMIYWTPPITHTKGFKTKNTHWINAVLFDMVREKIVESKMMKECVTPIMELEAKNRMKPVQEVNNTFPESIEVIDDLEELA